MEKGDIIRNEREFAKRILLAACGVPGELRRLPTRSKNNRAIRGTVYIG